MNPGLRPLVSAPGVLAVRPGLTLCWSETDGLARPPDTAVTFRYFLADDQSRMCLQRTGPGGPCGSAVPRFRAAVCFAATAIETTFAGDASAGAAALRRFAAGESAAFEHPLTPRARLALDSIRSCPFAGACRDMALTARCHDLIVEFLTVWSAALQPAAATVGPDDRVRLAAEFLERDLAEPPSLSALAAQVGLSESTLKRGFNEVFHTTVFGYVRARRMEQARRLLESGTATVLEAATLVGYSNPSNFAAAFRHQFGVNPKAFQLGSRRAD